MAENELEMLLTKATAIENQWFPDLSDKKNSITQHSLNDIQQNIDISMPSNSGRGSGLKGVLLNKLKIVLGKLSQPLIKLLFKRQIVINQYVLDLAIKIHLQQKEIEALKSELERHK